jgi:dihydrofolate synthase/folylpolyglutamate synthase
MGESYPPVVEADRAALKAASPQDLIFIAGSSYLVGDYPKKCL